MELLPLTLRLQELEQAVATGGTINHAVRMTMGNGYLHNAYLWPATSSQNVANGANYYGERIRLKSSYNISGYSAIARILLRQLQQYGCSLRTAARIGPFKSNIPVIQKLSRMPSVKF